MGVGVHEHTRLSKVSLCVPKTHAQHPSDKVSLFSQDPECFAEVSLKFRCSFDEVSMKFRFSARTPTVSPKFR